MLGLQSARMPGARRRRDEPIPDALLHERAAGRHARRARRRDAPAAARRDDARAARARARLRRRTPSAARCSRRRRSPRRRARRSARSGSDREEELFGPDETLHATFQALRDELLDELPRVGTRLGELRFDTDLDVAHAVVRYLELVKLAALLERPAGQSVADALPNINARLLQAVDRPAARDPRRRSALDEALLDAERDERARAAAIGRARRAVARAVPAQARRRR